MENYIDTREAASIAKVSDQSIRIWIKRGFIKSRKKATGRLLVDKASLTNFLSGKEVTA